MSENELDRWVTLAIHDAETARLLMDGKGVADIFLDWFHAVKPKQE